MTFETGRAAHVDSALMTPSDHRGLAVVVEAMHEDLHNHPDAWENHRLDRFLDALAAVLDGFGSLSANRGEPTPSQPSWALVAQLLVAATGYE